MSKEYVALKPCPKCGLPVKIQWIAGCSREIALAIRHPYGGRPTWHITCACGFEMAETVKYGAKKEQNKIQNKLIKEWNRQ